MSVESDGGKHGVRKKRLNKSDFNERSISIGSENLTQEEIIEIIGTPAIRTDKQQDKSNKNSKNLGTPSEKSANVSKESFSMDNVKSTGDIFKPRNSVARTPPLTPHNEQQNRTVNNENEVFEEPCNISSQKRLRSSASPATMENQNKIKKLNPGSSLSNEEEDITNGARLFNIETTLNEILDALERIHKNIDSFQQNETNGTRTDLFTIGT